MSYQNNNNKSFSYSKGDRSNIIEPSLIIMQKDADKYTRKLELERKLMNKINKKYYLKS